MFNFCIRNPTARLLLRNKVTQHEMLHINKWTVPWLHANGTALKTHLFFFFLLSENKNHKTSNSIFINGSKICKLPPRDECWSTNQGLTTQLALLVKMYRIPDKRHHDFIVLGTENKYKWKVTSMMFYLDTHTCIHIYMHICLYIYIWKKQNHKNRCR